MPTATLRKADGASGGSVDLHASLFAAPINLGLMHQAVVAEQTNRRQDTRDTKTRAEVAGGGKKPFRQKGTGRARQGSITAPHYRHGGIVFGPHPRQLSARLPKKARRVAIVSALSAKAADEAVFVLDALTMDRISTKVAAGVLRNLNVTGKALIVLETHDPIVYKSFRNIPGAEVRVAPAFSVRDVLDARAVIFVRGALDTIQQVWGGKADQAGPAVAAAPEEVAES